MTSEPQDNRNRQAWRRIWAYIQPDRRYIFAAIACAAGVSVTGLLPIVLVGKFANVMAGPALPAQKMHFAAMICLGVVVLYAVRWLFTFGDTYLFAEAGQRLSLRLRADVYAHLQRMSMSYFNDQRVGAMMSTINNDVPVLQNTLSGMKDIATGPFQLVAAISACLYVSPVLTAVSLVAFPFMAYAIKRRTMAVRRMTSNLQDKVADVNSLMAESLGGVRVIQSFTAEEIEAERFRQVSQEYKTMSMAMTRLNAGLKPTIDLIGALGISLALIVAAYQMVYQHLTIGGLVTFVGALSQLSVAVGSLGDIKFTWEGIVGTSERIWKNVLGIRSEIVERPDAVELPTVQGRIEFDRVEFQYKPDTPVLCGISFTMEPGQVTALVGLSGAGKSTISDLIPRFYDPTGGAVRVDGHDIRMVTLKSLRKQIGIVPQETLLFNGTIRDNIAYGNPEATEEMIVAAAQAANAHTFITDPAILPDGYATRVGERGKSLSGGQRQRIAIARALLKDPRILILDEATSSLDAESEHLVQMALDKLMKGRTTLVIAHRLSTIINADKIIVLGGGHILETGTHAELIQKPGGHYAQLYRKFAK